MKVNTHNDFDPLEEVIVGHAHHTRVNADISSMSFSYADQKQEDIEKIEGPIPQWVIDEANEDAEEFAEILVAEGITVHRPKVIDHNVEFSTPDWKSKGWYSWCPRDLILPLGDMLIETPSPCRARYFETRLYEDILYDAFEDGAEWIAAPKPRLLDDSYTFEDIENNPTLVDNEIVFDAPNIVRLGRDLLYQVSNSGNFKGYKWLKRLLEPRGYRLHYSELYSYAHFDSTIIPLRPGLVLLNSARVNKNNCPEIFKNWDKIFFAACIDQGSKLEGYPSPCSPYIGMNILSLDHNTVVVDSTQTNLIHVLEFHRFNVIPVRFRHARTLSGGIHCNTLDLRRKGGLEDYV